MYTFSKELDLMDVVVVLYWIIDAVLIIVTLPHTMNFINLPALWKDLVMFGKMRGANTMTTNWFKFIEIPKSYFLYFYIYGFFVSIYMLFLTVTSYVYNLDLPGRATILAWFQHREVTTDALAVIIVCTMMTIQHTRRVYECLFVSVYSNSTMNILHFLLGLILYSTVQLSVLSDGPKLNSNPIILERPSNLEEAFGLMQMNSNKLVGVLLFLWATHGHSTSHTILANLRKDRTGQKIIHKQHVLPRGGLFNYFSSPHMICEILIYIAMGLVAWDSPALWLGPVLFTAVNQLLVINETHKWYVQNFKDYPRNRCRFIPFVF